LVPLAYLVILGAYTVTGAFARGIPYPVPASVDRIAILLHLQEGWAMFAPTQPTRVRFLAPGRLADGSEIEVLRRAPLDWSSPSDVQSAQRGFRWTQYLENAVQRGIHEPAFRATHPVLLEFLCREWNTSNEGKRRLERVALAVVIEAIPSPGPVAAAPGDRYLVATRDCPPAL
jgi:hypothetical protein